MATSSKRIYANKLYHPRLLQQMPLSPLSALQATTDPHLCRRLPNTHRQVWFSFLWGLCSFPMEQCVQGLVCQESLLLPFLWNLCNQILIFRFPGDSQSLRHIPRLESLMWSLEPPQQCEIFFHITILQFVNCPVHISKVGLMATYPKRTYVNKLPLQDCCCQWLCPHGRPLLTHACAGDPQTLIGWSGSVPCGGHCSFPLGLEHTGFCLCPLRVSGRYAK